MKKNIINELVYAIFHSEQLLMSFWLLLSTCVQNLQRIFFSKIYRINKHLACWKYPEKNIFARIFLFDFDLFSILCWFFFEIFLDTRSIYKKFHNETLKTKFDIFIGKYFFSSNLKIVFAFSSFYLLKKFPSIRLT